MSDHPGIPELLCPAGSPAALDAAIEGGADAVYLGGSAMNARLNAGNFTPEELRLGVKRAHAYGVKVYLTLNTLVTDRELPALLEAARDASRAGVDALIVADLGGAAAIRRSLPEMELHASTQMSGHDSSMGAELKRLGFSRMVAARELPAEDLRRLVKHSPIETEVFVHGALCVSCSGQCLFSSLVGGRSGNRGECAQPCRLPFSAGRRGGEGYPLSLKDLSLAEHLPELIEMGVASLKIEGRMKSPEYVRDTARIWRRLLDEHRAATPEEMSFLAGSFSRSGFTDAYYTEQRGHTMLGVRRESDKQASKQTEPFGGLQKKLPLDVHIKLITDRPAILSLTCGSHTVTVMGDAPMAARTAPMTEETVLRSICRFGNTPYAVQHATAEVDGLCMLPVSRLNDLRRRAVEQLMAANDLPLRRELSAACLRSQRERATLQTARFADARQLTRLAVACMDRTFLPLFSFERPANGVVLPPVIYDRELPTVAAELKKAAANGAIYALVGNLGHLSLVREAGLIPLGDFRLNVTNAETVAQYERLGIEELLLSPELTLPQMRDIGGNTAAIVYGRIPLMTLEKCAIREVSDCNACAAGRAVLTDRRGISFPILREWEHRNVIYNSLPTGMSDRLSELKRAGIANRHFLFSNETPEQVDAVIKAYSAGEALPYPVRRI